MEVFIILLISFGTLCAGTSATDCVPETEKCSKHWEKILPHKNLMATESELDAWCSKQTQFYKCLEDVFLEGKNGNLSYLPTNLLISKLFAEDLCTENSRNRGRLLDNAECINKLNTDFCIMPEYLDIVTPDDAIPSTRCSQSEKTFSCIAATMVLNCGFDAGRVYRTMLKITRYSDDICGIETGDGIPPCEVRSESPVDRDKKLSETYYGLFHRIGDWLDLRHESESEEDLRRRAIGMLDVISDAIDSLDENLIFQKCSNPECSDSAPDSVPCSKDVDESKPYMKNPIITEVFPEFLFYNYSGIEYSVYWRQPLFNILERMVCEHLTPSYMNERIFRCRADYRYRDPTCLSNTTEHEKLTPEFIRSFDPEVPCDSTVEFGPRPEFMDKLDKMHEERRSWSETEAKKSSVVTEVPGEITTTSTLLHMATTLHPFKVSNEDILNFKTDLNSPIGNDLFNQLFDLAKPQFHSQKSPDVIGMKVGDSVYILFFNDESMGYIEGIYCARLNECHPKGRGLFKCKAYPRVIGICEHCEKEIDYDNFAVTYASPFRNLRKTRYTKVEMTTEPAVTVEASEIPESSTLGESIALSFSGDMESATKSDRVNFQNELSSDSGSVNDQANSEEEDNLKNELEEDFEIKYLVSDSETNDDVGLQILTRVSNKDLESSEMVYAIDDANVEDGESQVVLTTEDGLLAGNILLVKRISDFDEDEYSR